jgi:6-phosphogluconolactonase
MARYALTGFAEGPSLARAVAECWLERLAQRPAAAPFHVALSGGRIPKLFYAEVVKRAAGAPLFAGVHFFWGDERCVPPTDAASNFALAKEHLFQPLGIPAAQIHRIRGERPPAEAAAEAARELLLFAPITAAGQPLFDLVFLGLGEDGHVASLFPGEPESLLNSPAVYRDVVASKPPPQRVTLGYAALAAAREAWVLASGAGKDAALRESLEENGRTPLARLLRLRTATRIFSDIAPA